MNRVSSATDAPYTITHAIGSSVVPVDQTLNGGSWQLLGTYEFNGSASVELSNAANGKVIADAIRFVPVGTTFETFYVHTDHLGSPIALTDSVGAIQWQGSYDPYGKVTVAIDNVAQKLRFPGQYLDAETGLHYNYFRDYDPETERYLQSDPIGLLGGINTYAYARSNPLSYVDLYGLDVLDLSANLRLPSFRGSPSIDDSDGAKVQGFSIGIAISYPGSLGGNWDFGLIGSVAVGKSASVGTGKLTGSLTCSTGSLKEQDGLGGEGSFNDGIGGLAIGVDDNGMPQSVSVHVGPGLEVSSGGVVTGTLTIRDAIGFLSSLWGG